MTAASSYNDVPNTKESLEIRKNLKLRFNMLYSSYEVYTTIHGSGVYQWHQISEHVADWYKKHFGLEVSTYLQPSIRTGGLFEIPATLSSTATSKDQ